MSYKIIIHVMIIMTVIVKVVNSNCSKFNIFTYRKKSYTDYKFLTMIALFEHEPCHEKTTRIAVHLQNLAV